MMVSIQILSLLLWTFGLTTALEDNKRDIIPSGPIYKLIAKGNDGDTRFDGLELTAYHSFAGQADAVFTNKTNFAGGWLNDTTPLFHFGGPNDWQAGLNLYYSTVEMYDAWMKVTVDLNYNGEAETAAIVDGKLIYNKSFSVSWVEWLACEWVRLVPQLFYVRYDAQVSIPSNCARIDLIVEYLE